MNFESIVEEVLNSQDLSKEDKLTALKSLKQTSTLSDVDENFVLDIIRQICTFDIDQHGGGYVRIKDNSDPELVEKQGDGHWGSTTIKLTLPTKTIDKYTPEEVLRRWVRKGWVEEPNDYNNVDFAEYSIDETDLYKAATDGVSGLYITNVESLNNDRARFTIEYSWSDNT